MPLLIFILPVTLRSPPNARTALDESVREPVAVIAVEVFAVPPVLFIVRL